MILVSTNGGGSLDRYSQELASRLDVPQIDTDVYQSISERFNLSIASTAAVRALRGDIRFIRRLRSLDGPLHLPNHHLGRHGRFLSAPYVITVHDLIRYFDLYRRRPLIHRPNLRDRFYLRLDVAGIRRAEAVIAVSQTTRYDLVEHLGILPERVFMVYEGVDHRRFRPVEDRPFDFPYVLFVGSEHPRKNLGTLFQAFAALKATGAYPDVKLVKVGKPGGDEDSFRDRTLEQLRRLGIESEVLLAGYVPDEDLPAFYSGAVCTVLPSLYEGFGLPVVEAMACGSPVIVSSAGSLPEIAGDAALIVSPRDVEGFTRGMQRLLDDPALRETLRTAGLERAPQFDWDRAARETMEVYRTVEGRLAAPAAREPVPAVVSSLSAAQTPGTAPQSPHH